MTNRRNILNKMNLLNKKIIAIKDNAIEIIDALNEVYDNEVYNASQCWSTYDNGNAAGYDDIALNILEAEAFEADDKVNKTSETLDSLICIINSIKRIEEILAEAYETFNLYTE